MIIVVFLLGLLFAFFAGQNTGVVTVKFFMFSLKNVPLYLLILWSFILGLVTASVIKTIQFMPVKKLLKKKEGELEDKEDQNVDLTKTVHQLQLEKDKLMKKMGKKLVDDRSL